MTFFPHLVAGPILRYGDFSPQCATAKSWRSAEVGKGLALFVYGLALKVCLADLVFAPVVDRVFASGVARGIRRKLARRHVVFTAGLLRFRRLFALRDRCRADVRLSLPDEFRKPVRFGRHGRAVDALAHVAGELDARLRLHSRSAAIAAAGCAVKSTCCSRSCWSASGMARHGRSCVGRAARASSSAPSVCVAITSGTSCKVDNRFGARRRSPGDVRDVQHCRRVLPRARRSARRARCSRRCSCPGSGIDAGSPFSAGDRRARAGCGCVVGAHILFGHLRGWDWLDRLSRRAARGFDRAGAGRRRVLAGIQSGVHLLPVLTMNRPWLHAWIAALLVVRGARGRRTSGCCAARLPRHRAGRCRPVVDAARSHPEFAPRGGAAGRVAHRIRRSIRSCFRASSADARSRCSPSMAGTRSRRCARLPTIRRFIGLAIVGVDARGMQRRHWDMQQSYFDHYRRRWTLARWIHRHIADRAAGTPGARPLVVLARSISSSAWIAGGGMPLNDHVVVRADRVGFVDYHHPDLAGDPGTSASSIWSDYYRDNPPSPPRPGCRPGRTSRGGSRRIKSAAGEVVFFREPTAGESLELDEANFPRRPLLGRVCAAFTGGDDRFSRRAGADRVRAARHIAHRRHRRAALHDRARQRAQASRSCASRQR